MNSQESFEAKQAAMTNKDLIELVEKQISDLARSGGRSHRMCVPPMITDTDMLLSEMVKRFKKYSQSIGMAYMPTTVDKMESNSPVFHKKNVPEFEGKKKMETPVNYWVNPHDNLEGLFLYPGHFPEDKGFEKREALKSVKKNPLFDTGVKDWSTTTLKDIPENWLPEVGQEYYTFFKPSRTIAGPNAHVCPFSNGYAIYREYYRFFPTLDLALEYQTLLRELPPNWENADLDDVPVDWMPEKEQKCYFIDCFGLIGMRRRYDVSDDVFKQRVGTRLFPTERLAIIYQESLH